MSWVTAGQDRLHPWGKSDWGFDPNAFCPSNHLCAQRTEARDLSVLFEVPLHVFFLSLFWFFSIWQQLVLRVVLFRVIIVSPKAELGTLHYKMKRNYISLWKSVCEVIKQSKKKRSFELKIVQCGVNSQDAFQYSIPDVIIENTSGASYGQTYG